MGAPSHMGTFLASEKRPCSARPQHHVERLHGPLGPQELVALRATPLSPRAPTPRSRRMAASLRAPPSATASAGAYRPITSEQLASGLAALQRPPRSRRKRQSVVSEHPLCRSHRLRAKRRRMILASVSTRSGARRSYAASPAHTTTPVCSAPAGSRSNSSSSPRRSAHSRGGRSDMDQYHLRRRF